MSIGLILTPVTEALSRLVLWVHLDLFCVGTMQRDLLTYAC